MDTRQLILDTAERIFADHVDKAVRDRAESGELPAALWRVLNENGLTSLADAGAETGLADAYTVLRAAGSSLTAMPASDAVRMLSPALLALTASVLAPWSYSRVRHT